MQSNYCWEPHSSQQEILREEGRIGGLGGFAACCDISGRAHLYLGSTGTNNSCMNYKARQSFNHYFANVLLHAEGEAVPSSTS